MKNSTDPLSDFKCQLTKSVRVAVLFIIVAAIISALIIITSGLVLKKLYAKATISRADVLFIILSVSDIGVGVLKIPFYVLFNACELFIKCNVTVYFLAKMTYIFPFFSYFVTVIMAIDRLLIIKKNHDYRDFVTIGRLKGIIACCFAFTTGYGFFICYGQLVKLAIIYYFMCVYVCSQIVLPIICIAAYTHVLFYVHRHSNTMANCKMSGKDNNRRLYKTILLISVVQLVFNVPGSLMLTVHYLNIFTSCDSFPWIDLVWYSQNYLNGVMFLINYRKK